MQLSISNRLWKGHVPGETSNPAFPLPYHDHVAAHRAPCAVPHTYSDGTVSARSWHACKDHCTVRMYHFCGNRAFKSLWDWSTSRDGHSTTWVPRPPSASRNLVLCLINKSVDMMQKAQTVAGNPPQAHAAFLVPAGPKSWSWSNVLYTTLLAQTQSLITFGEASSSACAGSPALGRSSSRAKRSLLGPTERPSAEMA